MIKKKNKMVTAIETALTRVEVKSNISRQKFYFVRQQYKIHKRSFLQEKRPR